MLQATMTFDGMMKQYFMYDNTESSFWENVGKRLLNIPIPSKIEITCPNGTAELDVKKRGTYKENGVVKPSMFVTVRNYITGLAKSTYKKAYLTCVHHESNNYKAYILRPEGNLVYADYGRIDEVSKGHVKTVQQPYETYLYWIRYYEKLSKGYTDKSRFYLDGNATDTAKTDETGLTPHQELYRLLHKYAVNMLNSALSIQRFTEAQVKECRRLWKELCACKTVSDFNNCLAELIVLSPRKSNPMQRDNIGDYFARSVNDFAKIISFEETLVCAMEAAVMKPTEQGTFADTEVYLVNDKQKAEVMQYLSNFDHKDKIKRIWRVKPHAQEKRFADYRKAHNIHVVRKLWHGSRNANWASILSNGLLLNPTAQITGKMFGNGIYFAVSANKSCGYTSYRGSYWSNGNEPSGIMGLYATAYGTPYKPVNEMGENARRSMVSRNCNCVHAIPGNMALRNEEIVFYDESAVVLNYLVEFGD